MRRAVSAALLAAGLATAGCADYVGKISPTAGRIAQAGLDAIDKVAVRGRLTDADLPLSLAAASAGDRVLNSTVGNAIRDKVPFSEVALDTLQDLCGKGRLTAADAARTALANDMAGDAVFAAECSEIIKAASGKD